ncbi:hypothetical protein Pta02_73290 [Planobispora takensis]|uniref:Uncharacterized protein n=1 Tax=Planobispora takensis TaxID=1367882 RepID=A0A8J3WWY9_9ACTN|nr:hypothetical protein Pta02_73290 [Planobispora takensis]
MAYLAQSGEQQALVGVAVIAWVGSVGHAQVGHSTSITNGTRHGGTGDGIPMVAHRMRTVPCADRLAFLDGDRVVEEGDHEELVRRGGRYADFLHVGAVSSR